MSDDEEQIAALALADILTSAMFLAYEGKPSRTWLYCWERDGLSWLLRFRERRPDARANAWMYAFLDLNRDAILRPDGTMDFNLRRARSEISGA